MNFNNTELDAHFRVPRHHLCSSSSKNVRNEKAWKEICMTDKTYKIQRRSHIQSNIMDVEASSQEEAEAMADGQRNVYGRSFTRLI